MKPLTPVKAVALTALAASLALPAAKAQSPNPPASVPATSAPSAPLPVSVPPSVGETPISFDVDQGSVRDVLAMMFKQKHLNYVIEQGVSGTVNVHLSGAAFDKALATLLEANSQPLEYTVRGGVYHIRPRVAVAGAKEVMPAPARQVQIKFEWVSSVSASGAAPDKSVDSLTIIAEEGRKAQVSSQHLRNGAGGEETISVLPRLEPGGVVVLDITERSDSTAHVGDTKASSAETTVRVKDGETGTVRLQVSKQGGQGAERALFVTPTTISAGG